MHTPRGLEEARLASAGQPLSLYTHSLSKGTQDSFPKSTEKYFAFFTSLSLSLIWSPCAALLAREERSEI